MLEGISRDLGIIGPENTVDPGIMKPDLGIELDKGRPALSGTWKVRMFLKSTSTAEREHLSRPSYACPHAPLGTGAIWKYKAIYHKKESTVGLWSDVVSVAVFGSIQRMGQPRRHGSQKNSDDDGTEVDETLSLFSRKSSIIQRRRGVSRIDYEPRGALGTNSRSR